jgi:hypothetical protein
VLTATLTVPSSIAVGQRVVVIVTPAGDSMTTSTGLNVLQIN